MPSVLFILLLAKLATCRYGSESKLADVNELKSALSSNICNNREVKVKVVRRHVFFVCSAVHFAPNLTGLSSMVLI